MLTMKCRLIGPILFTSRDRPTPLFEIGFQTCHFPASELLSFYRLNISKINTYDDNYQTLNCIRF